VNFAGDIIYDGESLYSKARNTPFLNMPLKGSVVHTFIDGRQVIQNGKKA
jgi:dihydroorotase-like cyclic amidohydrolase